MARQIDTVEGHDFPARHRPQWLEAMALQSSLRLDCTRLEIDRDVAGGTTTKLHGKKPADQVEGIQIVMKKLLAPLLIGAALFAATPVLAQGIGHTWIMRG